MPFTLSEVDVSDADSIARYVEVPAMQNGPLYVSRFILRYYNSPPIGSTSRPDVHGGKSKPSTAWDWFDDDAADLRRDGPTWTICICARGTGGGSAVY